MCESFKQRQTKKGGTEIDFSDILMPDTEEVAKEKRGGDSGAKRIVKEIKNRVPTWSRDYAYTKQYGGASELSEGLKRSIEDHFDKELKRSKQRVSKWDQK